jgi:hypothetical protein
MRVLLVMAVAACVHGPLAGPHPSAAVVHDSHALLEAADRGDATAFAAATAPTFVRFDSGSVHERAAELARLKPRPPEVTRSWKDEHVIVRATDATFIGLATEREATNASHGNREWSGWYTISWVRDGEVWKAVYWGWQPYQTAIERQRDFWNDSYKQDVGFTHEPNRLLASTVEHVAPGAALDVATGQGRNALYLAAHGWTVTAIDIADEGLRRAREEAGRRHLAIDAVQADAEAFDYGVARWDLVTMLYAGGSAERIDKIKRSLRPGGLFVFEFFVDDEESPAHPGTLARLFADGFDIVRDEVVDDRPDWGEDRAKLVRFVARKR